MFEYFIERIFVFSASSFIFGFFRVRSVVRDAISSVNSSWERRVTGVARVSRTRSTGRSVAYAS